MPSASSMTTALARHAMSGKDMAGATAVRRRGAPRRAWAAAAAGGTRRTPRLACHTSKRPRSPRRDPATTNPCHVRPIAGCAGGGPSRDSVAGGGRRVGAMGKTKPFIDRSKATVYRWVSPPRLARTKPPRLGPSACRRFSHAPPRGAGSCIRMSSATATQMAPTSGSS